MDEFKLSDISISTAREKVEEGNYIGNDFALIDQTILMSSLSEPRRLTCLALAICTKGSADYHLGTIEHHVQTGDIIIINSGQVIDEYRQSDDCKAIVLLLDESYFYEIVSGIHDLSKLFTFSRMHPVFHLNEDETQSTLDYLRFIKYKMMETEHQFRRDIVRALILALIYDIGEAIARIQNDNSTHNTRAESIYIEFLQLVEENFRQERRVSWYAKALSITPKYLSETIRQVSRRTPNDWIDYYVVLELRVLLKNTTKTIKDITQYMNFPNQSFLGKYFKEHVGVSPSEYRKS
jgi:AraC family transcriptional activator of pobA